MLSCDAHSAACSWSTRRVSCSCCISAHKDCDASSRAFRVHYHIAYSRGLPAMHLVKIGKQPGVHMCSCLQLANRGLPYRHYFAVLLHDLSVQFDVRVMHPRWFIRSTVQSLPARIGTTSPHIHSPVDAERVRAVQYLTM